MKKREILCVLFTFALFLSCNDDDDGNDNSPTEYRISEITHVDGSERKSEGDSNTESKLVFTYTNEKLTLMTWYDKDDGDEWTDDYKQEFVYNGNLVTQTDYRKDEMVWTISSKRELTFENDLMTEKLYSYYIDGTQMPSSRDEFSFDGTMFTGYIRSSGKTALEAYKKGDAIYTNNALTKVNIFRFYEDEEEEWQKEQIEDFTYNGDLLNEFITTRSKGSTFENSNKTVYNYTGNLVSSMDRFTWRNETWELYHTANYLYNSDNYLIEMNYNDRKDVITYEEGKGNTYNLLVDPHQQIYKNPYFFYDD